MKFVATSSILALGLVGASAAASSLRFAKRDSPNGCSGDPGATGVANAINQWNSDVVTVNSFLEAAPTLSPADLVVQLEGR